MTGPSHNTKECVMGDETIIDWRPIATFPKGTKWALASQVLCCHETDRWIRFGRHYGELDRWYYSGTNERSQYSETVGGEPTHWAPLPTLPQ